MRTSAVVAILLLLSPLARPAMAQAPAPAPRLLALADLVSQSLERNQAVIAAQQAAAAAEANVALARSGRGPTVTASTGAGTAGGGTATTTPSFSSSASVSSSYVIYDSGQVAFAVRQAEAQLKSSRLALEAVRQNTALAVANAYVGVLRAQRAVDQTQQVVVQNQELLRLAQGQFQAGVVPRADVVSAQAGLAAAEGNLIAARNGVDQANAALDVAVGLGPTLLVAVAPPPPLPQLTLAQVNLLTLTEQRAEIRGGLADIEAAEAGVALAQAGGGLRLVLNGGVTQGFAPNSQTTYSVTTTVSLPVSDAGRVAAQVAAAQANLAAARARIETTRLTVQQQGVTALLSITSGQARVVSARAGLAFAEESLRLAQGRYAAGVASILEVINAQTALVQAQVTQSSAEFDQLAGVISLRYALGRSVVDGAI